MNGLERSAARPGAGSGKEDAVSLLDLLTVLVKRRWLIVVVTAGVFVLSLAFLMITKLLPVDSPWNIFPDKYAPTAKVLVAETGQGASSLSALLGSEAVGSLSGLLKGGAAGVSATRADLAARLLKNGNFISDSVAKEMDFIAKYKITARPRSGVRGKFRQNLTVRMDKTSGILEIGYKDIDAEFATNAANRAVFFLEKQFRELTLDRVSRKRRYLEESFATVQAEADRANRDLIAFQDRYGVLDLPTQASENIRQVSNLQAQVYSKQLELALQQSYLPESDARLVRLKSEISQLQKLINELKEGGKDFSTGGVAFNKLPELSVRYIVLKREAEIRQSILSMLQQQLEATKLEEMDTSQTIQTVEQAEIPEGKAFPSRGKILVIVTVVGLFFSVLLAFVREYFEKARLDPVEGEKLAAIRGMLGWGKGERRG